MKTTRSTSTASRSDYDLRLESYQSDLQKRFGRSLKGFTPVFYTFENALIQAACLDPCWRLAQFILRHSCGNHSIYVVGCSGRIENRCGRCDSANKPGQPLNQSDISRAMDLDRRRVSPQIIKLKRIGLIDMDKFGIYPIPNPELWLNHLEPLPPAVNHRADRAKYAAMYPDEAKELDHVERQAREINARRKSLRLKMLNRVKGLKSTEDPDFVRTSRTTVEKPGKLPVAAGARNSGPMESTKVADFVHPVADNSDTDWRIVLSALRKHDPGAERKDAAALWGECRRLSSDQCTGADVSAVVDFQAQRAGKGTRFTTRWLLKAVPPKFADDSWLSICRPAQSSKQSPSRRFESEALRVEYEQHVNEILDQYCASMDQDEFEALVQKKLPEITLQYPRISPKDRLEIARRQVRHDLRQQSGLIPTWEQFLASSLVSSSS